MKEFTRIKMVSEFNIYRRNNKKIESVSLYNTVLKSELFGINEVSPSKPGSKRNANSPQKDTIFKYKTSKFSEKLDSPYSLTPMRFVVKSDSSNFHSQ